MSLLKVNCNSCGNTLEIDCNSNYVTCTNCNSTLEVVKTGNSIFTKEHSAENSLLEKSETGLSDAKIYAEIELLDREWSNRQSEYLIEGTLPDAMGIYYFIIIGIVLGFLLILINLIFNNLFQLWIFGIFIILINFWNLYRREKYLKEKSKYDTKRSDLRKMLKSDS